MSTKETFELSKVLYDSQVKFMYYVIGLNVAAIGFTIAKTFDKSPQELYHIFLGLALLSWFLSIIFAFKWIFIQFRSMEKKMDRIGILKNKLYQIKTEVNHPLKVNDFTYELKLLSKKAERTIAITFTLFVFGIIFFTLWRIFIVFNLQL